jgi:hypothetical protein
MITPRLLRKRIENAVYKVKTDIKEAMKHKHKWGVARTIWPYAEGYGTYCVRCGMVLDTGLESKEYAQRIADELNEKK